MTDDDLAAENAALTEKLEAANRQFSNAVDEVFHLRRAIAYEAGVTAAHLTMKSFPKSRRAIAEEQIDRMRQSARGKAQVAYAGMNSLFLRTALKDAGADTTLTNWQWLEQQPAPRAVKGSAPTVAVAAPSAVVTIPEAELRARRADLQEKLDLFTDPVNSEWDLRAGIEAIDFLLDEPKAT